MPTSASSRSETKPASCLSRTARINSAAIFTGLLFWIWVWGVWGTILAVPMLMMLKAICDHIEDLQPIGELLGECPGIARPTIPASDERMPECVDKPATVAAMPFAVIARIFMQHSGEQKRAKEVARHLAPVRATVRRLQDAVAEVAVTGKSAFACARVDDRVVRGRDREGADGKRREGIGLRRPCSGRPAR